VKALFLDLAREFPGSEMLLEIYSKPLLWLRKRAVEKPEGKSDLIQPFRWGMGSAKGMERWGRGIKVVDEFPFYSRVELPADLDEKTLSQIKFVNFFRMMKMARLRFG
jgi:hypothetical protein